MNKAVSLPAWLQTNIENTTHTFPEWLVDSRKMQLADFIEQGLPTRKNERFKYTDLSLLTDKHFSAAKRIDEESLVDAIHQHRLQRGETILLTFVNGYFMPMLSDMKKLPDNVIACHLPEAFVKHSELVKTIWPKQIETEKYPFASLNAAVCEEGLFLYLPDQCKLTTPIHLLFIVMEDSEFIAHPHQMIILGESSQLTLIEEHFALVDCEYIMNHMATIVVGKNAHLEQYKIQQEGKKGSHMASTFVYQKQESTTAFTCFSFGGKFARDELTVKLQESGATCRTSGFYHLRYDNQSVDYHIDIDHAASHSVSEMLYKGVLDRKSRAIFNGRLHVAKAAQKINAYQANHNLLLADEAEVYSKPELEIYADEVKCKHGATTGQLDKDILFYLRSRGISHEDALAIMLQGFAEEVLQKVTHPGVKLRVQELMQ